MQEPSKLPATNSTLKRLLLAWYDTHRRILPWRALPGEASDPYRVLVSELMLQQTTVKTVEPRFRLFVDRFSDIRALAGASIDDVLHAWQGLGYYRRARGLHRAASEIVDRHGGHIPQDVEALEQLSGIGSYTARAVAAIAFEKPVVPVDGNVRRVLSRLAALDGPANELGRSVAFVARELETDHRPGDTAQALMELGALCCRPARPACERCPWRNDCRAFALGKQEALPRPATKPARRHLHATAWLARRNDGAILFRKRPDNGLLGGLIELPSSPWSEENGLVAPDFGSDFHAMEGSVIHIFTHIHLDMRLMTGRCETFSEGFFQSPDRLDELALPTLTKKLLRHGGIG
ncbi:MAG: A/G-specific adenine glycosylase [Geminicoccaceae bacterium]